MENIFLKAPRLIALKLLFLLITVGLAMPVVNFPMPWKSGWKTV